MQSHLRLETHAYITVKYLVEVASL